MKKRKGKRNARRHQARRHRNAASGGGGRARVATERPKASSKDEEARRNGMLQTAAVAVGGGALGALAAGIAVGAGMQPSTAAIVTLAGGAAGAYFLPAGHVRTAALGAACAAGGQLALAWELSRRAAKQRREEDAATASPKQLLPVASLPPAPSERPAVPDGVAARRGRNGDGCRNAWVGEPVSEVLELEEDEAEELLYDEDVMEAEYMVVD